MERNMDLELSNGQAILVTLDISDEVSTTVQEYSTMPMATSTMANGRSEKLTVKENIPDTKEQHTTANG